MAAITASPAAQAMDIGYAGALPDIPKLIAPQRPFKGAGHSYSDKAVVQKRQKAKASRKARRAQRRAGKR